MERLASFLIFLFLFSAAPCAQAQSTFYVFSGNSLEIRYGIRLQATRDGRFGSFRKAFTSPVIRLVCNTRVGDSSKERRPQALCSGSELSKTSKKPI